MNCFQNVKYGVSCREAAERYGVEVNRYSKALCPFHNDRHPSLYVADDHYHCFACGEHGDVIDFAAKLFGLPLYEAAQQLAADFHLTPEKLPSAAALHAKRIRTEAQQLIENERLCFSVLSDYARVLRSWKVQYAPQSPAEAPDERFEEACHKLDEAEYYLDILAFWDSYERAEVVNYLLVDGRLDKLKEKINGRDAARTRSMPGWIFQHGSMARMLMRRLFAGNFCQRTSSSMRTTHFSHRTDG